MNRRRFLRSAVVAPAAVAVAATTARAVSPGGPEAEKAASLDTVEGRGHGVIGVFTYANTIVLEHGDNKIEHGLCGAPHIVHVTPRDKWGARHEIYVKNYDDTHVTIYSRAIEALVDVFAQRVHSIAQ